MSASARDRAWRPAPVAAAAYRAWLTDRGSLTWRIAQRCPGVHVRVAFQGMRRPDRDERFLFAHGGRARVFVREVFLCCGDTPVVFAHTVVGPQHLRGPWRALTTLGTRPLGAALFADPKVERYPLRQRKIGSHHELHRRVMRFAPSVPGSLWARRSLFCLREIPILVTEVFLPAILRL